MKRRAFLATSAATAAQVLSVPMPARGQAAPRAGTIHTVRGPIDAGQMGVTLVHEHVLVDFVGAEKVSRSRYDAEEAFRTILPHLQDLQKRGCRTLLECTPAYLGRDPLLLRRLSEASGLNIVTNTGYYGAWRTTSSCRGTPSPETARQLAARWTSEARGGIEGTGVRPGFVKIGIDSGPLSDVDRKLVEAAALCHLDTGLDLRHPHERRRARPRDPRRARAASACRPSACVWVHAQPRGDSAPRATGSRSRARGWSSTGSRPRASSRTSRAVVDLAGRGLLDRVLVSQDAGWYHVGEAKGGAYRPYTFLFDAFVPALRARGLGEADIRTLLVENPARAFAVRRRALPGAA